MICVPVKNAAKSKIIAEIEGETREGEFSSKYVQTPRRGNLYENMQKSGVAAS